MDFVTSHLFPAIHVHVSEQSVTTRAPTAVCILYVSVSTIRLELLHFNIYDKISVQC